jgi:hypothetical protein
MDTGHIGRHTDTRISRTIAITSNPTTGMATGSGGSSDRAIRILGEAALGRPNHRSIDKHAED